MRCQGSDELLLLDREARSGLTVQAHQSPAGIAGAKNRPQFVTEQRLDKVERLAEWGEKHDHDLLEIGIGALAAQPGCSSVIAGATSPEQVIANAAAGEWIPTEQELAEIDEVLAGPGR